MNKFQKDFIYNEIWTLTLSAAFQRANIYINTTVIDKDKNKFKEELKVFIEKELLPTYKNENRLTDEQHINNIELISIFSRKHNSILTKGSLNFGVSQKLLNLILKYLWCLFDYPEPPHFPVDRRIQEITSYSPIIAWTRIDKSDDYMKIIGHLRDQTKSSIAHYEIEHFERRRNQI
jgi:hypothetical protein